MSNKITYKELVSKIANNSGSSDKLISTLLKEAIKLNKEGLKTDGVSNLLGIGRFQLKWNKTRAGRNPQTGEILEIPEHSFVKFSVNPNLSRFINRKYAHLLPEILEEDSSVKNEAVRIIPAVKSEEKKSVIKDKKMKKERGINKKYWILVPIILLLILFFCPIQCSNETESVGSNATLMEKEVSNSNENVVKEETQKIKEEILSKPPQSSKFSKHIIAKGESLSSIAKAKYGKASLWPLIYEANKDIISNPNRISAGKEIKIPELEKETVKSDKIDKVELGKAYFDVYLKFKEQNKKDSSDYLWVAMQLLGEHEFNQISANVDLKDLRIAQKMRGSPKI